MKPFFRTAEARGGVCEIAQSLRGGEYSSAGNCTFSHSFLFRLRRNPGSGDDSGFDNLLFQAILSC
ncbi:MAG: hypothetical protein L6W00_17135 [Lentisphaeria bacterium]|nr:MAG: hypothetical protein L6W00_17135 [Lentisphaeria bacterium]